MTATAGYDVPTRRPMRAGIQSPQVVVRLHPEPLRPRPALDTASDHGASTNVAGLTRAVHALVEALAPGMIADVSVVLQAGPADQPDPSDLAPDVIGDEQIRLDRRSRTLLVDGEPASSPSVS